MKRKLLFLFSFIVLFGLYSYSQISEGGKPPSFRLDKMELRSGVQAKPFVAPIDFDVEALKKEDAEVDYSNKPPRVGIIIPVSLDMENSGNWITLSNGQEVWQLEIKAAGAIAISLLYDRFIIPEGDQFFIYSKDQKHVLGAYTHKTNRLKKEFATEFVAGDEIVLEYVPANSNIEKAQSSEINYSSEIATYQQVKSSAVSVGEKPEIVISGIQYGYNHIYVQESKGLGSSGYCQVNINCPEGIGWEDQKKGVYKTITPSGFSSYLCSGTIVNNTSEDLDPLALTAYHCFVPSGVEVSAEEFRQQVYYFHYERSECGSEEKDIPGTKSLVGATLLVRNPLNQGSDGALLRLLSPIPADYDVYYNGWDARNKPALHGVGIHHPRGDAKKISTYIDPAVHYQVTIDSDVGVTDAHWKVNWVETLDGRWGTTEGGSSGSPLFNEEQLVVGTLTGAPGISGVSACDVPTSMKHSYYGKLWYHFDQQTDTEKHMSKYLDPKNTGLRLLKGTYAGQNELIAEFSSDKKQVYIGEQVNFFNESLYIQNFEWSFPGGTPSSSSEKEVAVYYQTTGSYDVILTVNKGLPNEKVVKKENYITVSDFSGGENKTIIIGEGSTTSGFPIGTTSIQTISSSIYTKDEMLGAQRINSLSWDASNAVATPRTLKVYMKEIDTDTQSAESYANEIADATLVFTSPKTWSNLSGWSLIQLDYPFDYSGNKHLKVIVQSISSEVGESAEVKYSVNTGKHQFWLADDTKDPTVTGTIDGNRPNIRLFSTMKVEASNPIANFALTKNVSFHENFDEASKLMERWTPHRLGESPSTWQLGNLRSNLFNEYDPTNLNSAFVPYDTAKIIDARLILKEKILITEGTKAEFYEFYSGALEGMMSFSVSVDDGNTWSQEHINGGVTGGTGDSGWFRRIIDLSRYYGKEVLFMFRYYGIGDIAGVDGFKLFIPSDEEQINLYVGERLEVLDLSEGYPYEYEWSFNDAVQPTSNKSYPGFIKYMTVGEHDVSLRVKNQAGEDSKTLKKAVIVKDQAPEIKISATGGYQNRATFGRFIPVGSQVTYTDASLHYPVSYDWKFEGGEPTASTSESEVVTYSVEGSYGVTSTVSNSAGSGTKTYEDFVLVGERAEIWNMPEGDPGEIAYTSKGTFLTGTNSNGFDAFAERFDMPVTPGEVKSVKIHFKVLTRSAESFKVHIYNSTASGNPGSVLTTTTVKVNDLIEDDYIEVVFENPAVITSGFFVVVEAVKTAQIAISSSEANTGGTTAYARGKLLGFIPFWFTTAEAYGAALALNIVPTFTYTDLSVDKDHFVKTNQENSVETIQVESNVDWNVTSSPWIFVKDKTENTFAFEVINNDYDYREGYIYVTGGGVTQTITVEQSAASPLGLDVDYDGDETVSLSWTTDYAKTEDIFDTIEDHTLFTKSSGGKIGWSYQDLDKSKTYGIANVNFPYMKEPMDFIVMNPKELGLESDAALQPHSGDQFLACFNAESIFRTTANNDWIISPRLNFDGEFVFSFWAKSYSSYSRRLERFNVYYTDHPAAGFTLLDPEENGIEGVKDNAVEVPLEWTQYTFKIPAGAQYVAINCVSKGNFMFMLDDLFIGQGEIPASGTKSQIAAGTISEGTLERLSPVAEDMTQSTVQPTDPLSVEEVMALAKAESEKTGVNYSMSQLLPLMANVQTVDNPENSTYAERVVQPLSAPLKWHDGEPANAVGFKGVPFEYAVSFDKNDLLHYIGLSMDAVELAVYSEGEFNVKIYINDQLKVTQPLGNLEVGAFNTVALNNPILFDNTIEKLVISIEVVSYPEEATPAVFDAATTQRDGKGDMLNVSSEWQNLSKVISGTKGNWVIAGIFNWPKVDLSYNVYRNGEQIGSTDALTYVDKTALGGTSCYAVSSIQKDVTTIESALSEEVCQFVKYSLTVQANNVEKFVGEENPIVTDEYTIKGFVDGDNISFLSKKPVASVDPIFKPHIGVGTYKDAILVSGAEDADNKYRFTYLYGNLIVKDHPVGIENVDGVEAKVYPTVTTGIININQLPQNADVYVFDFLGRMILTRKLQTGDNTIDISSYAKGVYFVKVGNQVTKVIKQ